MEPLCFKVPRQEEETVRVEYWNMPYFYEPFHFHEECQITYILEGKGMLFVGSMLNAFNQGDLFLIGKNLPHVFRNDEQYYYKNSELKSKAISIFFSSAMLLNLFKGIPELKHLKTLLENSLHGIKLGRKHTGEVEVYMDQIITKKGYDKLMKLFDILNLLSSNKHTKLISRHPSGEFVLEDDLRMNKVFDYIMMHFHEQIRLEDMADLVNMTPTSFCRYFKIHTKKTFSRFMIEVRISKACKLLTEEDHNVTQACYLSGFNNISNFHRHFRRVTGLTPNEYRKKLQRVYSC
ncbi:MAG: AraC family transcriptional regulator [Bacteroidota bacterium]